MELHVPDSAKKNRHVKWIVLICLFIQIALQSYWLNAAGPFVSPVIHFLSMTFPGVILVLLSRNGKKLNFENRSDSPADVQNPFIWMVLTAILAYSIYSAWCIYHNTPIDLSSSDPSDIIPQIAILVKRFLSDQYPYIIISDWGYDLFPTYLPLHWGPYILAEVIGFDYRWIAFIVLFGGIMLYIRLITALVFPLIQKCLLGILPFSLWFMILKYDTATLSVTVEAMIAGYYLLVGVFILQSRSWALGFAILFCILSRYSLVIWLPLLFLVQYFENRTALSKIILVLLAGVFGFYVFPFLMHDPLIFFKGYEYHSIAAISEWNPSWQADGEHPFHLFRGLGFAGFFYEYVDGPLEVRLNMLQFTHLGVSIIVVGLLSIFYIRNKNTINQAIFLLGSLSIYLSVFYAFIQIPYSYLYITPVFLALAGNLAVWNSK